MSTEAKELLDICGQLSPDKQARLASYARGLLAEDLTEEVDGDAEWERIINDPRPRPKLEAFVKAALAEGSEPLDPDKL